MTPLHGMNGKVVWNAEHGNTTDVDITHVVSWSIDATVDVADASDMGSTGNWREYMAGLASWTGTIECNFDSGGFDIPISDTDPVEGLGRDHDATTATQKLFIELWFTQSATEGIIYGPAICTGISPSVGIDDIVKVTYAIQSNGETAFVTAEPTDFAEPLGS